MNGAPTFDCAEFRRYWRAELGEGATDVCLIDIMQGMINSGAKSKTPASL